MRDAAACAGAARRSDAESDVLGPVSFVASPFLSLLWRTCGRLGGPACGLACFVNGGGEHVSIWHFE